MKMNSVVQINKQSLIFDPVTPSRLASPFTSQLLKWIGNKQRFAQEIVANFPQTFGTYFEPFLGSGAVLGSLAPCHGVGSDAFAPLMEIWQALSTNPKQVIAWYAERWLQMKSGDKFTEYERIKSSYNAKPNGADLLFLCRSCYGGVVRFRQRDGYMSTPLGPHDPISPQSFEARVKAWSKRVAGTQFLNMPYQDAMAEAQTGDLVYCDPPYSDTQRILYGAQEFRLADLLLTISECKQRGVYVALSIDGTKRSGDHICDLPIPEGLFEREILIDCGRSMLKRFQMNGQSLERHAVQDRLLLTY